jgi:excisionase family DNA binding protein
MSSRSKPRSKSKSKPSPSNRYPVRPTIRLAVSRREAGAALGVDIQTIDGLISAKKLKASKVGRRVLIRIASIEKMLDAHAVQS